MHGGHLVPGYPVADIQIGRRFRQELTGIEVLAASIRQRGLLVPPTVTGRGLLVLGERRVAALRLLEVTHADVWVLETVSDGLGQLLAMRDDLELAEALKPSEQAALYAELLEIAKDAARHRQQLTQFGYRAQDAGGAESAPPVPAMAGKARQEAARAVTGTNSYQRLEEVLAVQELTRSPNPWLAEQARQALVEIDRSRKVAAAFTSVKTMEVSTTLIQAASDPRQSADHRQHAARELSRLRTHAPSRDGLAHAKRTIAQLDAGDDRAGWRDLPESLRVRREAARFLGTVTPLQGGWVQPDPAALAAALTDEQWQGLKDLSARLAALVDEVAALRAVSRS
ncbi:ParB N-terminal domain-containing protein [Gryllotalpicola reticulitermitis]|uniref:ParB N-terminal domain-containing protein n=1 Tax=Gryllotalpicola reticulitermitis TaxID=1184153 RepID=A0ABV8QBG6_9MICO